MALTATIYTFEIELADSDRGVYETLALRVARHPSEATDYLLTRVLAYCLEHTEGIAFSSGGLSDPDEPPLAVRDLTGALRVWIEIGAPDAARVHRACKAAPRVAVYTHKNPSKVLALWAGERIHRADALKALTRSGASCWMLLGQARTANDVRVIRNERPHVFHDRRCGDRRADRAALAAGGVKQPHRADKRTFVGIFGRP